MKKIGFGLSALALSAAAILIACSGDDVTEGPSDGGDDASPFDGSFPDSSADASTDAAPDAGPSRPPWALFTINYSTESDLAVLSLDAGAYDGILNYPSYLGSTSIAADGPWALEQATDVVAKLDPAHPWIAQSSWSVLGTDDGGLSYTDPYQVVAGPAGKDYVIRFNRNEIAVIDTTKTGTNLAPETFVDLSMYVTPGDADGEVDAIAGIYVASQHRVYVLLSNFDRTLVDPNAYFTLCTATHAEIVAIDTDHDALVSAVDGGATTAPIVLGGYDAITNGLVYDGPRARLLAINGGCSDPSPGDAGVPGTIHEREIDAVDLGTGATSIALDLNAVDQPLSFALTDPNHIVLRLEHYDFSFGVTNLWDVTTSVLGASVANAPDFFAADHQGNLVGASTAYLSDGGEALSFTSVQIADGGVTNFPAPHYSKAAPILAGVDVWSP